MALYFLAVNVLFGPLNAEKDRLQQQVNQKREETQALEAQVQACWRAAKNDPDAAKRKKIDALQENLKTMDAELARVTAGLVPPKEMARLIEQMLLKNRGLQVMQGGKPPGHAVAGRAEERRRDRHHGLQARHANRAQRRISGYPALSQVAGRLCPGKSSGAR